MELYAVILFDKRTGKVSLVEQGLSEVEADLEVARLRKESFPAYHLTHEEYKKRFGSLPNKERQLH